MFLNCLRTGKNLKTQRLNCVKVNIRNCYTSESSETYLNDCFMTAIFFIAVKVELLLKPVILKTVGKTVAQTSCYAVVSKCEHNCYFIYACYENIKQFCSTDIS